MKSGQLSSSQSAIRATSTQMICDTVFIFPPDIGGDHGPLLGSDQAHRSHKELTRQNDEHDERGTHLKLDEADERRKHQQLIGQRVHQLAEICDKSVAASGCVRQDNR